MSTLSIYIVEDEKLYANQLEILVDELGYHLAGMSANSDTAKIEIEDIKPDLILMDIKIDGSMNGIDLASHLLHQAPLIFITSFDDEATFERAKQTKPYAYIVKPFDASNLQRTIELAFNKLKEEEDHDWQKDLLFKDYFFVKNRNRLEKVSLKEVNHLEVEDRYSTIHSENGRKYVLRMSMGEVMEKLQSSEFMRIHRKYTVNLHKIRSIDTQDNLIYVGEAELPISRTHKDELLQRLDWLQ